MLLELLECFKTRNDSRIKELVTDDATPSTIFEYVLGIFSVITLYMFISGDFDDKL